MRATAPRSAFQREIFASQPAAARRTAAEIAAAYRKRYQGWW